MCPSLSRNGGETELFTGILKSESPNSIKQKLGNKLMRIWKSKNIKILLRLYLMHLQNLWTVTATHVNHVKIQLTGGKFSKILWMI